MPANVNISPSFKSSFVTLSKENLGHKIKTNVVDTFNRSILPEIQETQAQESMAIIQAAGGAGRVIQKPEDYQDKVNFFALGAGSGSRFKELAQTVGNYNKISLPFKIDGARDIHMLDFAMTMGKAFIEEDGVKTIIADKASGTLGDVVQYYLDGSPIKDTVVCCGDNVFGDSAKDMLTFFTKLINDPNKHVGVVGIALPPEEIAGKFAVLHFDKSPNAKGSKIIGFTEKPSVETARENAINGKAIGNTGFFYFSKEAMEKLIEEIKNGENHIKKNDKEPYDFAYAIQYIHSKTPDWFGISSEEACDYLSVNKWEDVGEPKALYKFLDDVKKHGTYMLNFPKNYAQKVRASFQKRINMDAKTPYINFTDSPKVTKKQISQAKTVDDVNIVV